MNSPEYVNFKVEFLKRLEADVLDEGIVLDPSVWPLEQLAHNRLLGDLRISHRGYHTVVADRTVYRLICDLTIPEESEIKPESFNDFRDRLVVFFNRQYNEIGNKMQVVQMAKAINEFYGKQAVDINICITYRLKCQLAFLVILTILIDDSETTLMKHHCLKFFENLAGNLRGDASLGFFTLEVMAFICTVIARSAHFHPDLVIRRNFRIVLTYFADPSGTTCTTFAAQHPWCEMLPRVLRGLEIDNPFMWNITLNGFLINSLFGVNRDNFQPIFLDLFEFGLSRRPSMEVESVIFTICSNWLIVGRNQGVIADGSDRCTGKFLEYCSEALVSFDKVKACSLQKFIYNSFVKRNASLSVHWVDFFRWGLQNFAFSTPPNYLGEGFIEMVQCGLKKFSPEIIDTMIAKAILEGSLKMLANTSGPVYDKYHGLLSTLLKHSSHPWQDSYFNDCVAPYIQSIYPNDQCAAAVVLAELYDHNKQPSMEISNTIITWATSTLPHSDNSHVLEMYINLFASMFNSDVDFSSYFGDVISFLCSTVSPHSRAHLVKIFLSLMANIFDIMSNEDFANLYLDIVFDKCIHFIATKGDNAIIALSFLSTILPELDDLFNNYVPQTLELLEEFLAAENCYSLEQPRSRLFLLVHKVMTDVLCICGTERFLDYSEEWVYAIPALPVETIMEVLRRAECAMSVELIHKVASTVIESQLPPAVLRLIWDLYAGLLDFEYVYRSIEYFESCLSSNTLTTQERLDCIHGLWNMYAEYEGDETIELVCLSNTAPFLQEEGVLGNTDMLDDFSIFFENYRECLASRQGMGLPGKLVCPTIVAIMRSVCALNPLNENERVVRDAGFNIIKSIVDPQDNGVPLNFGELIDAVCAVVRLDDTIRTFRAVYIFQRLTDFYHEKIIPFGQKLLYFSTVAMDSLALVPVTELNGDNLLDILLVNGCTRCMALRFFLWASEIVLHLSDNAIEPNTAFNQRCREIFVATKRRLATLNVDERRLMRF